MFRGTPCSLWLSSTFSVPSRLSILKPFPTFPTHFSSEPILRLMINFFNRTYSFLYFDFHGVTDFFTILYFSYTFQGDRLILYVLTKQVFSYSFLGLSWVSVVHGNFFSQACTPACYETQYYLLQARLRPLPEIWIGLGNVVNLTPAWLQAYRINWICDVLRHSLLYVVYAQGFRYNSEKLLNEYKKVILMYLNISIFQPALRSSHIVAIG